MPICYSVLKEHLLIDLCCTILPKLQHSSWEQRGALSARCKQCLSVRSAYKILHLAAPKDNGRDTDNTQGCSPARKEQSFVV